MFKKVFQCHLFFYQNKFKYLNREYFEGFMISSVRKKALKREVELMLARENNFLSEIISIPLGRFLYQCDQEKVVFPIK